MSNRLPIFNVPFPRNGDFIGQEEILELIHKSFTQEAKSDVTSSYVLYGLGGVGKTQVAIEYSYRHRLDFDIIYWIRADSYEILLTSYHQLYDDQSFKAFTGLDLGDESNSETVAASIKNWFENCQDTNWLIILDNLDNTENVISRNQSSHPNVKTIATLIPNGRGGCVLVTNRNTPANGQSASTVKELDVMCNNDAKSLLLKCSRVSSDESEEASLLVETLCRLPLAIEQAGGYIRENGVSIAAYRQLYKSNKSKALGEGLSTAHRQVYYHQTVATTWDVSFETIDKNDPLANIILRISSFLDGKFIQKDLFYNANLSECGRKVDSSDWEVNKSFGTLMSYSLVHAVEDKQGVEMHLLVQDVVRDALRSERQLWFKAAAKLVGRRFPWGGDINNLKGCIDYLSQARTCVAHALELQISDDIVTHLLESTAGYYEIAGQYADAFVVYDRALKIRDHQFGVDHVDSADTIMGLGSACNSQGKFDEAIGYYERALAIKDKTFGVDHVNTAKTINNLGLTYHNQGKYVDAIEHFQHALAIYEKAIPVDHVSMAKTINHLGLTYHSQGKYDDAIECFESALRIYENEFSVDHINAANSINNLGMTYGIQRQNDKAFSYFERALRIYEKAFGENHINTANTINNLGLALHNQMKYDDAIVHYERALKIYENAYGPDHINTANTINNLGSTYGSQGKYNEAIGHFERALKIKENAYGKDHVNTADTIMNIGLVYKDQGQADLGRSRLLRSFEIFKSNLGETHPQTLKARSNLHDGREEDGRQDGGGAQPAKTKRAWDWGLKLFSWDWRSSF